METIIWNYLEFSGKLETSKHFIYGKRLIRVMPFQEAFLFPLTNILNRLNILEKSPYFLAHLHTLYILYICKHAIKLFKYANTTAIT